jgi:hypothetical protein
LSASFKKPIRTHHGQAKLDEWAQWAKRIRFNALQTEKLARACDDHKEHLAGPRVGPTMIASAAFIFPHLS